MADDGAPIPNGGVVRWDRLNEELRIRETQLREDWRRELEAVREEVKANTGRARGLDARVDKLESWRDRVAGPVVIILATLGIIATASNIAALWLR